MVDPNIQTNFGVIYVRLLQDKLLLEYTNLETDEDSDNCRNQSISPILDVTQNRFDNPSS